MYVCMQYHHEVHEHEIDSSPGGHLGAQAVHSGAPIASLDELRLCEPGTLISSDYPRDYLPIERGVVLCNNESELWLFDVYDVH